MLETGFSKQRYLALLFRCHVQSVDFSECWSVAVACNTLHRSFRIALPRHDKGNTPLTMRKAIDNSVSKLTLKTFEVRPSWSMSQFIVQNIITLLPFIKHDL